ncbi:outer membrane beta-barrel protein [Chryseobacterium sp. L7]|uniref:Outer membrane beta-barrel protein n=1 Tax=Chryseobacterium endalhagicum TaxID=2797638 RepID=A0ABS1QBU2_9FLAO|nr:outer membrane beta-barrel protein [Chryseobacterium endalhagicum]MBL1220087.1 outer membrane beta-barrel protein [Chryseobacterium endalhagicum]
MAVKKLILIIFFLILYPLNAQRKKTDTLYVYEKVIVYDTVYLEKALKIKPAGIHSEPLVISDMNTVPEVPKFEYITITDTTKGLKIKAQKFEFGAETGMGLKNSSWAKESSEKSQQTGFNAGIWISGSIYKRFSLMLSAHIYYWNSTFSLDTNKAETWLDGYYFTEDRQPLLFQKFNDKHLEYALQLKLFYEWKKFRPFIGILANQNVYKMQFMVPENNVLNKLDDFKSKEINFGYSFGIQYRIMRKFLLSLEYQEYKMRNISLKNSAFNFDIFKTNNTFAERKINLGISYTISSW